MKNLGKKMRKVPLVTMLLVAFATIAVAANTTQASPAITAYFDDLNGFNLAAGSPPVVVNFDDIAADTDITGRTIHGIKFLKDDPTTAPLIVVKGDDTFTLAGDFPGFFPPGDPANNRLFPTSVPNVLSPGGRYLAPGPDPALENDSIKMELSTPVRAIGFDILFQSLDGISFVSITLLDGSGAILYTNPFIPIGTLAGTPPPGGHTFVGFVSDSNNIAKIIIDESDDNNINPDSNIGYDTIRSPGICVFKFYDANGDGIWNNGDYPIANWPIYVKGISPDTNYLKRTSQTNIFGEDCFIGLPFGTYYAGEQGPLPIGWKVTTAPYYTVKLTASSPSATVFIGNKLIGDP